MNYIYTLIPIALIGFAAVQGSKWNFNAATYMDKKYTNAVKGMMCVVIMYVHISNDYTNTVQNIIGSFAYYRQPLPQQETTDRYHEPDPDGVEEPAGYRTRPYL